MPLLRNIHLDAANRAGQDVVEAAMIRVITKPMQAYMIGSTTIEPTPKTMPSAPAASSLAANAPAMAASDRKTPAIRPKTA